MTAENDDLRAQAARDGQQAQQEVQGREAWTWAAHVEATEAQVALTWSQAGYLMAQAQVRQALAALVAVLALLGIAAPLVLAVHWLFG